MPVITILLLLSTCLIHCTKGAPNKKAKDNEPYLQDFLMRRKNVPYQIDEHPFTTRALAEVSDILSVDLVTNPGSSSASSIVPCASRSPLTGFQTGYAPLQIPSGHLLPLSGISSGSYGSGRSNGFLAYPTQGAPYQNSTLLYTQPSNLPSLSAPAADMPGAQSSVQAATMAAAESLPEESGAGSGSQGGSGAQCPSPQTVTLPAQTITVTAAAQTVTQTVTIAPQTQTITSYITVNVTAGPVPANSNAGSGSNIPTTQAAAPEIFPSLAASSTAAGIVHPANTASGAIGGGASGIIYQGTSIMAILPSAQTGGQGSRIPGALPPIETGGLGLGTQGIPAPTGRLFTSVPGIQAPAQSGGAALGSGQSAVPILPVATSTSTEGLAVPNISSSVVVSAQPFVPFPPSPGSINVNGPTAIISIGGNAGVSRNTTLPKFSFSPSQGGRNVASATVLEHSPSNITFAQPVVQPPSQITNTPSSLSSGKVTIGAILNSSSALQANSFPLFPLPSTAAPYPLQNQTSLASIASLSSTGLIGSIPSNEPSLSIFAGPTNTSAPPLQSPPINKTTGSSLLIPPFQPSNVSTTVSSAVSINYVTNIPPINSLPNILSIIPSTANIVIIRPSAGLPLNPTSSSAAVPSSSSTTIKSVISSNNFNPLQPLTGLPPQIPSSTASAPEIAVQGAPPSPTSNTKPTCFINGTSSQSITANVRLPPPPSPPQETQY